MPMVGYIHYRISYDRKSPPDSSRYGVQKAVKEPWPGMGKCVQCAGVCVYVVTSIRTKQR